MQKTYLIPVQQKAVYQTENDTLVERGFFLCLEIFEFVDPLVANLRVNVDIFLFIEMVVAAVIGRDFACLFDSLKETDETGPRYCPSRCIPVLDVVYWMDRDKLLGLREMRLAVKRSD